MQDGGQRCKLLLNRRIGLGECEVVAGLCLAEAAEGEDPERGVLWYAQQPLPSGGFSVPICSHQRPSPPPPPPPGWQGGRRRSVTGLGNEPGKQPVGGDDGWVSQQVYHCDTHIQYINTH